MDRPDLGDACYRKATKHREWGHKNGLWTMDFSFFFGDPLGVRTQDPNIKSVVLYRLS